MYDIWPNLKSKRHKPAYQPNNNSLPKLTILTEDSQNYKSQFQPKHSLCLNLVYRNDICSQVRKQSLRHLQTITPIPRKSKSIRSDRIVSEYKQNAKINRSSNMQLNNKIKLGCVQFCREKLKQFKKQIFIVKDKLVVEKNMNLHIKTEMSDMQERLNNSFIEGNKSIKIEKILCENSRKRSKNEQKLKRVTPHSLVMITKKNSVLKDCLSPWQSSLSTDFHGLQI